MTVWLGLRLSLRSGKEAAVRLAVVAAAVAVGVTVLLATLSVFRAVQSAADRPCWECTTGSAPSGWAVGSTPNAELWNYRLDSYAGRVIRRLDVAALGPRAPVVPGLPRVPGEGRYYASPALAALLDSVPREQLADRFPGSRAGLIGKAALSGPDDLVVVVGRPAGQVAAMPSTVEVDTIETAPAADDTTALYGHGIGIAAIGLLFPLLVLIGTASRLAAARREARFAAIRLVGATARQINIIASMDAALGALLGTLAGLALFQLLRPALVNVSITGSRYFPELMAPAALHYAAVVAGVPLAATCAALWSLRRVRISPLGTARKAPAPAPTPWRMAPLVAGLAMFAVPAVGGDGKEPNAVLVDGGLVLVMVGLVIGGPWLTMLAARLAARLTSGAATLLAARRLVADPKTAFRSVNGLVLAVFIGTAVAGIVPAVVSGQEAVGNGTLSTVMRTSFDGQELSPQTAAELLTRLRALPGVTVLPVYAKDGPSPCPDGPCEGPPPPGNVVECASLAAFPALGRCSGTAVTAEFNRLLVIDNMLSVNRDLPLVDEHSPAATAPLTGLNLSGVLARADSPAVREQVRTLLSGYLSGTGGDDSPMTFSEVAGLRAVLLDTAERAALAVVALTLLVAGCSVAVAVGGGLVERRQPFTLLRLSGTPARTLARVVLLESALPLVLAVVLAAVAGLGVAEPVIGQLRIKNAATTLPGAGYFLTVAAGLLACLLVILSALPLLKRMTAPDNARFE